MKLASRLTVVVVALSLGCADHASTRSCPPGALLVDGECASLCTHDLECADGRVCSGDLCVPGTRPAPRIAAIDGDGTELCPGAAGTHCIAEGLWVSGENLDGGVFTLTATDGGSMTTLAVLAHETTRVHLGTLAPATFAAGDYVLAVVNRSGSADQTVTFLQGPPGPDLTADELIARINSGTATLSFARLAGVAALGHTHRAEDVDLPGICAAACTGPCQSCSGAGQCQQRDDRAQHGCTAGFVCVRGECEQQIVILINELAGSCASLCSSHAGGRPCVSVGIDEAGTNSVSMASGPGSCQEYAADCATAMTWDGYAGPTCSHHRYGNWTNCRCSF